MISLKRMAASHVAIAAATLLVGCGGGGGDGSVVAPPAPTPTPTAQVKFTSISTDDVPENQPLSYRAAAQDVQGRAVAFAITGGADADFFAITEDGKLSFTRLPDFEAAEDANHDNQFEVRLSASNGVDTATMNLTVRVSNVADNIALKRIGSGLVDVVATVGLPDSDDLLIAQRDGKIYRVSPATGSTTLWSTIGGLPTDNGHGLTGMAIDDTRRQNDLWVSVFDANNRMVVTGLAKFDTRYSYTSSGGILSFPMPAGSVPRGGALAADGAGGFYLVTGDGGQPGQVSDLNSPLGKIFHMIRNPDPYAGAALIYYLPDGMEGAGQNDGSLRAIWATGLHDPQDMWLNGSRLFIPDRGKAKADEFDTVDTAAGKSAFLGWPQLEGQDPVVDQPNPHNLLPSITFPISDNGPRIGPGRLSTSGTGLFAGQFVFGDDKGGLWTIAQKRMTPGAVLGLEVLAHHKADITTDQGTLSGITHIAVNRAGTFFIVDAGGDVFQVAAP
tara:strand:- start:38 stop:1540 length:1503 start_codon:yes stop_codon:yes gene_type:complete